MIYSAYILVHPRTQQLQNVLTLEDYHQIQALLDYCLQRQQLQGGLLQQQRHNHENREYARLVQAIHNNKLLQLDYRRQRAAQIQRLMRQHQQQLDQYDRARLLASLEKQRSHQCFRRFLQNQYQPHEPAQHKESTSDNIEEQISNEPRFEQQLQQQKQIPAQIQVEDTTHSANGDTETSPTEDSAQQEEDDDDQVDDAYEQYQRQQLEDLLKHIFEKNTKAQQQQSTKVNDDEEDDEYAYVHAPCYSQPDDHEDQQTMADLLPILNDNDGRRNDSTPPIPPKSMMQQQQQQQQQQQPMDTTPKDNGVQDVDDEDAFLPDNVLPLQDVVDDLVRIPTPAVQPPPPPPPVEKKSVPQPPKKATPPPVPTKTTPLTSEKKDQKQHQLREEDVGGNKERREKLEKLATIEQKLDQLATDNHAEGTTHLPLQYQVNDQGGLILDGNTHNNHKFLMMEDDIIRCMLQLDQILSDGDPVVRDQRRKIVKKAENLLEPLDQHKQAEWNKETKRRQQQQQQSGLKKKHHRRHGKRKAHIPVTA
ncbi:hypothetical protein BCR42DRAFT_406979 [Absidia repens]|uniref:BAG domain-containing protein n=1 Tax=Absidia repens TaxID=90262 RepID=A0A1X2IT81_9FUNG|nr:hypothetical protein BCR42DRAFT_406979 [Absidia repens]